MNGDIVCGFILLEWEYGTSHWWKVENNPREHYDFWLECRDTAVHKIACVHELA
jgi:hypothetical protein